MRSLFKAILCGSLFMGAMHVANAQPLSQTNPFA